MLSGDSRRNRIVLIVSQLLFSPSGIIIILDFIPDNASNAVIQILRALGHFSIFALDQRVLATLLIDRALRLIFRAYTRLGSRIASPSSSPFPNSSWDWYRRRILASTSS